jgi:hypothetical protein
VHDTGSIVSEGILRIASVVGGEALADVLECLVDSIFIF